MLRRTAHIKIALVLMFAFVAHIAMAAFTGTVDDRSKNKFNLKNLNNISKHFSLSTLHPTSFQFKGSEFLNQQTATDNSVEVNSMVRLERGNTTYVYPYKYKVKVPKFKTPVRPVN